MEENTHEVRIAETGTCYKRTFHKTILKQLKLRIKKLRIKIKNFHM